MRAITTTSLLVGVVHRIPGDPDLASGERSAPVGRRTLLHVFAERHFGAVALDQWNRRGALKTVYNPETPELYELGLIYKVTTDDQRVGRVDTTLMTPTASGGRVAAR